MIRWPVVILVLMTVLGAMVSGCDRVPRYDGRLTALDSLMRDNPDSVVAVLESLSPKSSPARGEVPVRAEEGELPARGEVPVRAEEGYLTSDYDRAYRDLLLTQARYKAYITATSDSDINRALAYFSAHPADREKLTRAYIYKGAVMDELGHPDSAMLYYKHAEATAAPDDYFNLGYINTRIGSLYRYYYADVHTCYEKYKKAFDYYNKSNDSSLLLNSLYNMGMCSGILGNGNAQQELMAASALALELNDSSIYYDSQEMLVRQSLFKDSSVEYAKQIAQFLLHDFKNQLTPDLMIDLANLYIKESKIDSAKYYLLSVNKISGFYDDALVKIRKYSALAEIAQKEGDLVRSQAFADSSRLLTDSIRNNKYQYGIQFIEKKVNDETAEIVKKEKHRRQLIIGSITIMFLLLMSFFIIYQNRKIRIVKSIIRELKSEKVNNHESLLKELRVRDSSIAQLVENIVIFMRTSIDAAEKDSPKVFKKRIRDSIQAVVDENFWKELRTYLDTNYNNIISNIAQNKKINETDIRFIELICCGFSYLEIAVTLGYSPNFVSNKRMRVAKKLGIKTSLQDFLLASMSG